MKTAVTTEGPESDSRVDPRFGRAPYFVVFDTDSGTITPVDNRPNLSATQGAGIQAARHLIELGVAALVTGHVGPKAFTALQAGGVTVYTGATGTAAGALERCRAGGLKHQEAAECCGRGHRHRHGHWHGGCAGSEHRR